MSYFELRPQFLRALISSWNVSYPLYEIKPALHQLNVALAKIVSHCLYSLIIVVKISYFDNTGLRAFILMAFRAPEPPIYTAYPWHFCCHFCIMNDNDLVLLSQHFGERSMDNFQYITVEARENGKVYTACIQLHHIVSINSGRYDAESTRTDNLHAIHLVDGQKIWVDMSYTEILNALKKCGSFPVRG
jgi:hypothetical protein